jgi:hypothetical protein
MLDGPAHHSESHRSTSSQARVAAPSATGKRLAVP